jgi:hypothetical protein
MATPSDTSGLSRAEILRQCIAEVRGLREDLERAGLVAAREKAARPKLRVIDDGGEADDG